VPVEGAGKGRGKSWREGVTLFGVLGLLVTLFFQTLGVWEGAGDDRASREAQQVGLLTSLNSSATSAESDINDTVDLDKVCDENPGVTDDESRALNAAIEYYEYLAWLFNSGRLDIEGARSYFAPRMIDGWKIARAFYPDPVFAKAHAELATFVRETKDEKDQPPKRCP